MCYMQTHRIVTHEKKAVLMGKNTKRKEAIKLSAEVCTHCRWLSRILKNLLGPAAYASATPRFLLPGNRDNSTLGFFMALCRSSFLSYYCAGSLNPTEATATKKSPTWNRLTPPQAKSRTASPSYPATLLCFSSYQAHSKNYKRENNKVGKGAERCQEKYPDTEK